MTPNSVSTKQIDKLKKTMETRNKYLTLIPTDENKNIMKKYEEMWSKYKDQQIINQMVMMKNI